MMRQRDLIVQPPKYHAAGLPDSDRCFCVGREKKILDTYDIRFIFPDNGSKFFKKLFQSTFSSDFLGCNDTSEM